MRYVTFPSFHTLFSGREKKQVEIFSDDDKDEEDLTSFSKKLTQFKKSPPKSGMFAFATVVSW